MDHNIPQEIIEKMERYEELKVKIKEMESEMKELAPGILEHLPKDENDQYVEIETSAGKFYVQDRGTWQFSGVLEDKKKQIKEMEKEEKAEGTAVKSSNPVLYYSVHKE